MELIDSKEGLIRNQQILFDSLKGCTNSKPPEAEDLKPGVGECIEFVKCHAPNGALVNGFLIWVWIQRRTTPENIWKTQAVTKFTKEEITAAKEELWKISGKPTLGKMVRRQGTSKTVSELEDICSALKTLSETDSVPMFLGTSEMIMHTPVYNIETGTCNNEMISSRLRVLDESVNSLQRLMLTSHLQIQLKPIKRVIYQRLKDQLARSVIGVTRQIML